MFDKEKVERAKQNSEDYTPERLSAKKTLAMLLTCKANMIAITEKAKGRSDEEVSESIKPYIDLALKLIE